MAFEQVLDDALVAQLVKSPPAMRETWVQSLGWQDPLEKGKATPSVFWPREFHGWRNLVGYSPSGCKELDMTEQLHLEDVFVRWKMGQREVAKKALMGRWNSTGGGSKAGKCSV